MSRRVRRRTAVIFLVMLACFGVLAGRLAYVQGLWAPRLQEQAKNQRLHQVPLEAPRGRIYDCRGNLLATSLGASCIVATPAEIVDARQTARTLASILQIADVDALEKSLRLRLASVWIKRQVRAEDARRVLEAQLPGIKVLPRIQRFYPGGLAGQVLGFAGSDNQGLEGLEVYYDPYLRGRRGWDMAEYSAVGRQIPAGQRLYVPALPGNELILTIDANVQFIAERELEQAVAETGSRRGLVIVMDPRDGSIMAMASRPRLDPNNFLAYPQETWKNICVTDQFEPGSTFKIVTAAAALEEGVVTPRTSFFDPGFLTVDDRHLHCWYPGGHGSQTFVEAIENSCNPVFASLALSLGPERFLRYIRAFGFGARSGIDFPGEATGTVPKPDTLKRVELATMGFGQGVSVTSIQLVTAMAAIANGGYLVRPHFLKELRSEDGRVIKSGRRETTRQVISAQTSATMRMLLESVVVNGSGNRANIPGYRVAGKTGTAQKPGVGGYSNEVVASFIGFAPAENPRLVALVLLDEPQSGVRYGGVIAAPVFARIAGSVLRNLNIPAKIPKASAGGDRITVPNLYNLPLAEAQALAAQAGLRVQLRGEGSYVFDQVPKPGARVEAGTTVLLYFDPAEKYNRLDEGTVQVPDLSGLRPDQAAKMLDALGLKLLVVGEGLACAQEPKPGAMVKRGAPVVVSFKQPAAAP
ncbi:MAG: penicillin-binding transpeptidase domain-containing protein [Patescibacteria group bacterium]